MKGIQDAGDIRGKRVLVRIDVDDGEINPFPITVLKPTLSYLIKGGARIILLGHVGREQTISSEKLFKILKKEINLSVVEDLTGDVSRKSIDTMQDGEVLLLGNVRSDERESINDDGFAKELATLADIYVNDAFAVSHRRHASVVGITKYLPSFAGLLLQAEVKALSQALTPESPSLFIISGAKLETKLPLIEKFVDLYDYVFVGGVPANNFFKAKGLETGISVTSDKYIDLSSVLNNKKVLIPSDVVVIKDGVSSIKKTEEVSLGDKIVDSGPGTTAMLKEKISRMRCIVWNGPLGEYELGFDAATKELARMIAEGSAHTLVGGGDTLTAITDLHLENAFSFISTGGGAMLEFLLNGTLPGIDALA